MKKAITSALIVSGTIVSLFILNLILYMAIPQYRILLESVVPTVDDDIPVVYVNQNESIDADALGYDDAGEAVEIDDDAAPLTSSPGAVEPSVLSERMTEESPISSEQVAEERAIINREYHEDCGTGKGYWVITYSDGSTEIEE